MWKADNFTMTQDEEEGGSVPTDDSITIEITSVHFFFRRTTRFSKARGGACATINRV